MRGTQRLLQLCLLFLCCSTTLSHAYPVQILRHTIVLGETPIQIVEYQSQNKGRIYYHPHEDEKTSLQVTQKILQQYGGTIISLSYDHNDTRLVSFHLKQQTYTFDPNRIFSSHGIDRTLQEYGPDSRAARLAVAKLSRAILSLLSRAPAMVAIHNNLATGYSIQYYMPGGPYHADVKMVYRNPKLSDHTLVLVTDQKLFDFFKNKKINVILQDNEKVRDDGSLSYYAGKHHIPYINIETERGNAEDQYKILKLINLQLPTVQSPTPAADSQHIH